MKEPVSEKRKKAQVQQEVESAAQEVGQAIEQELAQGEEIYRYPPITLLEENHTDNCTEVGAELRNNSRRLADACVPSAWTPPRATWSTDPVSPATSSLWSRV